MTTHDEGDRPATLPAVWTVPREPHPGFRGRDAELAALERAWSPAAPPRSIRPWALHGVGGVGKTRLAIEYAWRSRHGYDAVLWVEADTRESLCASFAALAVPLGIAAAGPHEQLARIEAVRDWLRNHGRWLLVFDAVESDAARAALPKLLPPGALGHVLLTSRRAGWPRPVEHLALGPLALGDAAQLVLGNATSAGSAGPPEGVPAEALEVARALGALPLALELGAAQLRRFGIDMAQLHARLAAATALASQPPPGAPAPGGAPAPVEVAWRLIEAGHSADVLGAPARALLRLISHLAPRDIPRHVLLRAGPVLARALAVFDETQPDAKADPNGRHEPLSETDVTRALLELESRSWLALGPGAVSVSPALADVQRLRTPPEQRTHWLRLGFELFEAEVAGDPTDAATWPAWDTLRPHVARLLELAATVGSLEPVAVWTLRLGQLYRAQGLAAEAEPLLRRALLLDEERLGPQHPDVARDLTALGQLLHAQGRLAEAEPLLQRALAINESAFGADHPNVAHSLDTLARQLHALRRSADAERLLRRALAIHESTFGAAHPSVAGSLHQLARVLHAAGRAGDAEPLLRRAVAIDEAAHGGGHPRIALRLNDLAHLLQSTRRLAEAEAVMRRALAIDEESLGPDHPRVARDLNNLAQVLAARGQFAEAEPLMRRALAIDERCLGSSHPSLATRLQNLARLLRDMARLTEAEPVLRRALAIHEKQGPRHPRALVAQNELAQLLLATNRAAEADFLQRRTLASVEQRLAGDGALKAR